MREDVGSRTEADAAAWAFAHRPDPEVPNPSELTADDGRRMSREESADLTAALVALQERARRWAT